MPIKESRCIGCRELALNIVVLIAPCKLHGDKRTYVFYLLVVLTGIIGSGIKQYFANALTLS